MNGDSPRYKEPNRQKAETALAREERLKKALRANLQRRKGQARVREAGSDNNKDNDNS